MNTKRLLKTIYIFYNGFDDLQCADSLTSSRLPMLPHDYIVWHNQQFIYHALQSRGSRGDGKE